MEWYASWVELPWSWIKGIFVSIKLLIKDFLKLKNPPLVAGGFKL